MNVVLPITFYEYFFNKQKYLNKSVPSDINSIQINKKR